MLQRSSSKHVRWLQPLASTWSASSATQRPQRASLKPARLHSLVSWEMAALDMLSLLGLKMSSCRMVGQAEVTVASRASSRDLRARGQWGIGLGL